MENMGDNSRIVFSKDKPSNEEIIQEGDTIIVYPDWFANTNQRDAHSCAYYVAAAMLTMGDNSEEQIESQQQKIIQVGLEGLKDSLIIDRSQLSKISFQKLLTDKYDNNPSLALSFTDLPTYTDNSNPMETAATSIKEGTIIAIEDYGKRHLFLGIGVSENLQEIICWDPLLGQGSPIHPHTRLRRINIHDEDLSVWAGIKASESFQKSSTIINQEPHIKFGETKAPSPEKYVDQRGKTLTQILKDFISSV